MSDKNEKIARLLEREGTGISWADLTFNPWIGCQKVSPACANCYAEDLATKRLGVPWGPGAERRRTAPGNWSKPMRWQRLAAEEVAWAMKEYQITGGADLAEAAAKPVQSYQSAVAPAESAWRPGIVAGVRHLSEAAAALADAACHLPDDQAKALRGEIASIQEISERYRPKRASYSNTPEFPTE